MKIEVPFHFSWSFTRSLNRRIPLGTLKKSQGKYFASLSLKTNFEALPAALCHNGCINNIQEKLSKKTRQLDK